MRKKENARRRILIGRFWKKIFRKNFHFIVMLDIPFALWYLIRLAIKRRFIKANRVFSKREFQHGSREKELTSFPVVIESIGLTITPRSRQLSPIHERFADLLISYLHLFIVMQNLIILIAWNNLYGKSDYYRNGFERQRVERRSLELVESNFFLLYIYTDRILKKKKKDIKIQEQKPTKRVWSLFEK